MASWSKCTWDSFPEPLTGGQTCTSCRYVCEPVYQTPELCTRYCPNYLELLASTTMPYEHFRDDRSIITGLLFVVFLLCAAIFTIAIWKTCRKRIQDCHSSRAERNESNGSNDAEGTCMLEECTEVNMNITNEKPPSPEINFSDSTRSSSKSECITQSTVVSSNGDQSDVTVKSSQQQYVTRAGSNFSSLTTTLDGIKSFDVTTKKGYQHYVTATDSQQSKMTDRSETAAMSSLLLNLTTSGDDVLLTMGRNDPDNIPHTRRQWSEVLRAYDAINVNIKEMPWIAGCILGNDRMKVIVDGNGDQSEIDNYRRLIAEQMPDSIDMNIFQVTCHCTSFELRCGRFGAGSVLASDKCQLARIIILGDDPRCRNKVVLTVAHLIRKGESCELLCHTDEKIIRTITGECCAHIHTLGEGTVTEVRRKLYDLALVRLPAFVPDSNIYQYSLKGRSFILQLVPPKSDLHLPSVRPGRKVFVFAGNDGTPAIGWIDRDEAALTCTVGCGGRNARQTLNLIKIHCPEVCSGSSSLGLVLSGSAVAFHPDDLERASTDFVRVEAFAMIVGVDIKKSNILCALPLWGQMEELFAEDNSLAYLKHCSRVSGSQPPDSGYYSKNLQLHGTNVKSRSVGRQSISSDI